MRVTSKQHPQDCDHYRGCAYDAPGEQLGALWKIVTALLSLLTDEQRAAIDPDALAVMARVDDVKRRHPRKPKSKKRSTKS